jgi:hypothetical protein
MVHRMTLTALVVLLFSTAIAYPQAPRPQFRPGLDSRGTPADQRACRGDARRLCRSVLSYGDFAVLSCLRENRSMLSAGCREVLIKYGQ